MEKMSKMPDENYQKQPWQWVIVYLLIGLIVIGLIYYFLFYVNNGANRSLAPNNQVVSNEIPAAGNPSLTQVGATQVTIENFQFSPTPLTIKKGDTVTWTNRDSVSHTVTSDIGGELSSGTLNTDNSYIHTFNTAGTFNYHCNFHPSMHGTVIITEL